MGEYSVEGVHVIAGRAWSGKPFLGVARLARLRLKAP